MKTLSGYGILPVDLGLVDISPEQSCLCLYMPISTPTHTVSIPDYVSEYAGVIEKVLMDYAGWSDKYIYLTVKAHYVKDSSTGQRPGWHSDGFMTEDTNYIWYDSRPTEFYNGSEEIELVQDHELSLLQMMSDERLNQNVITYPPKHLLKMDQFVIHKPQDEMSGGFRVFVKISVSDHIYALKGNTENPLIQTGWSYKGRSESRNCPVSEFNNRSK